MHGALDRLGSLGIRSSDHLSMIHPPARNECATDLGPMIAATVLVDDRSAPEFTPSDHRHVIGQSTLVKILDQRAQTPIENGSVSLYACRVVGVKIPTPEVEGYHANSCLDQPAGQKKMLVVTGRSVTDVFRIPLAVSFPNPWVLPFQVQSPGQLGRTKHPESFLSEGIHLIQVVSGPQGTAE